MFRKIAAVGIVAGSLAVAGPASAHGRDGGAIVGALIGGAVLGALVTSALNPPVAYQAPVYQQPAYQPPAYQAPAYQPPYGMPAYQQAQYQDDGDAYGAQPSGYCYDNYRHAYVGCYAQPRPSAW